MSPVAIRTLGVGQLVNWGVLYYAFAVLLQPVQRDLGVAAWVVTGAFSMALLISAIAAPAVGRWADRGFASQVIVLGGLAAALLLGLWAWRPNVYTLYAAWACLGVCMACVLYEPAFAIVMRAHPKADQRLRALAVVTLFGGLASTVFLPTTAGLVAWVGWRGAVAVLAGLLIASAVLTALGVRSAGRAVPVCHDDGPKGVVCAGLGRRLRVPIVIFGLASLASASFVTTLVPALGERGETAMSAAVLGGLFGVMQLPGRALLMIRRAHLPAAGAVAVSLALQAAGLIIVSAVPTIVAVVTGVVIFAIGSGLTTVVRPYYVQAHFGIDQVGLVNGRLAMAQQLARAAGPIAVVGAAGLSSYAAVNIVIGVLLCVIAGASAVVRLTGPG